MNQAFDENSFNFLQIRSEEVLMKLQPTQLNPSNQNPSHQICSIRNGNSLDETTSRTKGDGRETEENLIVANVSPLEFGNSLFVPDAFSKLSQGECHGQADYVKK
jgi:hypothetical protein